MPRYQYIRIPGHKHPITISYEVMTKPNDSALMMQVGVAVCHNKDPFSKEFGRRISDGRRAKTPLYVAFEGLDPSSSFGRRIINSLHIWVNSSWREILKER